MDDEASTMKIMQAPNAPQSTKDSSDWLQGSCYQMWRCRHNAFRGDGAFGQFIIIMPEQDAVMAITAETPDMQKELNLVWQYLLPAFKQTRLPPDAAAVAKLKKRIKTLALPLPQKNMEGFATTINGKNFITSSNDLHLQNINFSFLKDLCRVRFQTDAATYQIDFAAGRWQAAETNMPGPSLTAGIIENTSMIFPVRIAASYAWKDANTLELVLRYIESPHTETFICHFHDNKLTLEAARSLDFGKNKMVIEAEVK